VSDKLLFILFLLCTVLGCRQNSQPDSRSTSDTTKAEVVPDFSSVNTSDVFVYNCADSLQFSAHVTPDSAWIFLADTAAKLEHVQAASGAKYQNPDFLYWSKGEEALFQGPTGSLMDCMTIPKEKSWQAAKIRGVDFRAMGQEPGWILEITKGKQMQYIGRYGQDTLITPAPMPQHDTEKGVTVYESHTNAHSLTVKVTEQSCTDSMSGSRFPSTVTVTVDGETYRGCGRTLD